MDFLEISFFFRAIGPFVVRSGTGELTYQGYRPARRWGIATFRPTKIGTLTLLRNYIASDPHQTAQHSTCS